jgi:hypothetical protein
MHGERVRYLKREHIGMIPRRALVTGGHEKYEFSVASECCHQCQRGRLLIKLGWLSLMSTLEASLVENYGSLSSVVNKPQVWLRNNVMEISAFARETILDG